MVRKKKISLSSEQRIQWKTRKYLVIIIAQFCMKIQGYVLLFFGLDNYWMKFDEFSAQLKLKFFLADILIFTRVGSNPKFPNLKILKL